MKILAFDTATEVCTVALYIDGETQYRHQHIPLRQADNLLVMIDELMRTANLSPAQLTAIAFGRGPGSFTGLRLAAGVAQGIAMGAGIPVIPVSTLAVIAQTTYRCHDTDSVLAVIDARMQEIYAGFFSLGTENMMLPIGAERVLPPEQLEAIEGVYSGAGNGFQLHAATLQKNLQGHLAAITETLWPHAIDMLPFALQASKKGELLMPDAALPVYLRDNVAQKKTT